MRHNHAPPHTPVILLFPHFFSPRGSIAVRKAAGENTPKSAAMDAQGVGEKKKVLLREEVSAPLSFGPNPAIPHRPCALTGARLLTTSPRAGRPATPQTAAVPPPKKPEARTSSPSPARSSTPQQWRRKRKRASRRWHNNGGEGKGEKSARRNPPTMSRFAPRNNRPYNDRRD